MAAPKANSINMFEAIHQICAGKGLDRDAVIEIIRDSLMGAYKKKYGQNENVEVRIDKDNDALLVSTRTVVEKVEDRGTEISVKEIGEREMEAAVGDTVEIAESPSEFSRIATVTAKHIVLQKLREIESRNIYDEFKEKEGELIHGFFHWARRDVLFIDLGKVEAIMPRRHQMPNERYRQGDRIKAIIHKAEYDPKGPKIILSRTSPEFVKKLFELEIPEIYDGIVTIESIARQAGIRSKIMVRSTRDDVDPVGACVGMRGVRIQSIVRELGNERIDIIPFTNDPEEMIINAMSPANIQQIRIDNANNEAICIIKDDELSLAIGKDGSNVKLACQVTGYRIDLKTESEFSEFISSPEARARLDQLFGDAAPETEEDDDGTALAEIPGLTKRVIRLLEAAEIRTVEELVSTSPEDLLGINGMTQTTVDAIYALLAEVIEFED